MTPWRTASLVVLVTASCAGGARPPAAGPAGRAAADPLDRAALPLHVVRVSTGEEVPLEAFLGELASARAVCVGESHANPHHHYVQRLLLDEVGERARAAGRQLALGLEMFQRPFQPALDAYATGRIDEAALLERSDWRARWGFDFALYRSILSLARDRGHAILALNAPQEITRKVARRGLAALSAGERATLPDLDLEDPEHLRRFREAAHGHALPGAGFDDFYAAQVIWDETMAETAARWIDEAPGRRAILIAAGTGHCHASAVPARLRRRGIAPAVAVLPVLDSAAGEVAAALDARGFDFLIVLSPGRRGRTQGSLARSGGPRDQSRMRRPSKYESTRNVWPKKLIDVSH